MVEVLLLILARIVTEPCLQRGIFSSIHLELICVPIFSTIQVQLQPSSCYYYYEGQYIDYSLPRTVGLTVFSTIYPKKRYPTKVVVPNRKWSSYCTPTGISRQFYPEIKYIDSTQRLVVIQSLHSMVIPSIHTNTVRFSCRKTRGFKITIGRSRSVRNHYFSCIQYCIG